MLVKLKPVYNFQSAEFEIEIDIDSEDYDEQIAKAFSIYSDLLMGLKNIAPEQPAQPKPVAKKTTNEEPATKGQLNYLDSLGIPYPDNLTKKEAFELINKAKGGK